MSYINKTFPERPNVSNTILPSQVMLPQYICLEEFIIRL